MEEDRPITSREHLLVVISAIILAGKIANYSTVFPSITLARGLAKDLISSILDGKKL